MRANGGLRAVPVIAAVAAFVGVVCAVAAAQEATPQPLPEPSTPASVLPVRRSPEELRTRADEAYEAERYRTAYRLYRRLIALREPIPIARFEKTKQNIVIEHDQERTRRAFGELVRLVREKQYEQAEARLLALNGLEGFLDKGQRARLPRWKSEVAWALGKEPDLTAAQKKGEAERLFREGKTAYEQKHYALAREKLEATIGYRVSIGPRDNARLNKILKEVDREMAWVAERFREAERLYDAEHYQAARQALMEITGKGIDYGAEIQESVEKCLSNADVRAQKKVLSEAAAHAEASVEMARERRKIIEQWRRKRELRQEAGTRKQAGDRAWQKDDLQEARAHYEAARDLLDEADDETTEQDRHEVVEKLDAIQRKVEAQEARRRRQDALRAMLQQVAALGQTDLLAAEARLREALDFQQAEQLDLTPEQRAIVADLERALSRKYGDQIKGYRELLSQSENYRKLGEWERELELLRILQEMKGIPRSAREEEQIAARIRATAQHLQQRQEVIARVDALAEQAEDLLQAGKPAAALARYQEAMEFDREGQVHLAVVPEGVRMPAEALAPVLQRYSRFAARAFPELIRARLARQRQQVRQSIREAIAARDHWIAAFHMAKGSPDVAKPLLEGLAARKDVHPEHAGWAKRQLEGIDAAIKVLQERELLALRNQRSAIYEMELEFKQQVEKGDMEAAEAQDARIRDAQARLRAARVRRAIERGAWPVAHRLLEERPDDPALKDAAGLVQAWERRKMLLAQTERALVDWDGTAASKALADMGQARLPPDLDPFAEPVALLERARDGVRSLDREAAVGLRDLEQGLATVNNALAVSAARREVWELYLHAVALYAAGRWQATAETLQKLPPSRPGLRPFERAHADSMRKAARAQLQAQAAALAQKKAEEDLSEIAAKIQARRFITAARMLEELAKTDAYQRNEAIQAKAEGMCNKINAAEQEAAGIYKQAAEAYSLGDDRLESLLETLRTQYQHTRVFAERQ